MSQRNVATSTLNHDTELAAVSEIVRDVKEKRGYDDFYKDTELSSTAEVALRVLGRTRHRCSRQTLPMRGRVSPGTELTPTPEIELRAP